LQEAKAFPKRLRLTQKHEKLGLKWLEHEALNLGVAGSKPEPFENISLRKQGFLVCMRDVLRKAKAHPKNMQINGSIR